MRTEKAKILVVFSRVDATHRQMLEGILRYVHDRCADSWQVILDQRDIYRSSGRELARGGYAGVIAAVATAADRRLYLKTGLPTVLYEPMLTHLARRRRPARVVTFFNDHAAEGCAAADYFLARGHRSFAFVGTHGETPWSRERLRGYCSRLERDGFHAAVYHAAHRVLPDEVLGDIAGLGRWLRKLPTRTAILAAHDERALQVLAAAAAARRAVPEDLAVLGVDDDELLCTTASPSLSSIPVDARETGARFAEALHALLVGRAVEPVVRTCHTRVVTRQSTDAFAGGKPIVTKALDYIHRHLGEPICVPDLAAAVNSSRRTLEMHMRAETGNSPAGTIMKIRLAEAVRLLTETDLRVNEIARRCGFCTSSHLGACLRQNGYPAPTALRAQAPE